MRIALAQINSTIGDFAGNQKKILDFAWKAKNDDLADLILFPELSLCGAPPLDLLENKQFTDHNMKAIRELQDSLPEELAAGIGYVKQSPYSGGRLLNAYGIIHNHELIFEQYKMTILRHDYFDQTRYFDSGRNLGIFDYQGERLGILPGEDAWQETLAEKNDDETFAVRELAGRGISMLCVPCASPFIAGNSKIRGEKADRIAVRYGIPVMYINAAGANDSVIFDGRSFVHTAVKNKTNTTMKAKIFEEDMIVWNHPNGNTNIEIQNPADEQDETEKALILGIRDYMKKCGFAKAHLGLSGGIDSALVAWLAAKAIGVENVVCFNMPSRFSSQGSKDDSRELAVNLGCRYEVLPIDPVYDACLSALENVFENRPFDVAEENLQARIRGVLWMGYANKFNSMLLAAGNKSELAMGYCTLYGDTNGALAPIGDLFKTEVFAMCKRINERSLKTTGKKPIPQNIIDKPPSAELRPGQTDQDSLPPYETLDEILKLILYENKSPEEIAERGFEKDMVNKITRTIIRSEWKRRQTPPVLKVSRKAFGVGRNQPLARAIFET